MEVGLYRSGMFMLMARKISAKSVPENVAWLGQVESAWKPSLFRGRRLRLWQFIPGTGARYGLRALHMLTKETVLTRQRAHQPDI